MLRPVAPYVEFELNKEYIAEFLCINKEKPMTICGGKCYLSKELQKANEQDKSLAIDMNDYPISNLLANSFIFSRLEHVEHIAKHVFYEDLSLQDYHSSIFRPPIA